MSGKYVRSPSWAEWQEEESVLDKTSSNEPPLISARMTEQPETRLGMEEVKNLIPLFNPGYFGSPTALEWLKIINKMRAVYQWTDRTSLLYASIRLDSAAKFWYNCRQGELCSWKDFQEELVRSFPDKVDESAIHIKLMSRKRKPSEPIETYFYEVLSMAQTAKLSKTTTINYLISGIGDRNLSNVLTAGNCQTPDEFLSRVKVYEGIASQEKNRAKLTSSDRSTSESFSQLVASPKCYLCGKSGHLKSACGKSSGARNINKDNFNGRCFRCGKLGHRASSCFVKQSRLDNTTSRVIRNVNKLSQRKSEFYQDVDVDGEIVSAFIDLGSDCCTIRKGSCPWRYVKCNMLLSGFAGGECSALGKVHKLVKVGDIKRMVELIVVEDDKQDVPIIIGQSLLNQPGIKVTKTWNKLKIEPDLHVECTLPIMESQPNSNNSTGNQMRIIRKPLKDTDLDIKIHLNKETKDKFINMINTYRDCFATNVGELGQTTWTSMEIKLRENKVIRYSPYRVPYHQECEIKKIIEELKDNGVIEDSNSQYASPALLVKKKNGSYRMCVDYRRLNEITYREYFPTPNIEEELNRTAGGRVFISLDLMSGYHQVPVEVSSRQYTAFVTTNGHYQYRRMPFGLTNAPACFLRLMDKVKARLNNPKVRFYLDDIIIMGSDIHEALQILEDLLKVLREANLTLNTKKCTFFSESLTYLGHEIGNNTITPGSNKLQSIDEYPEPTNIKEVRQFLGLTGYFRKFIMKYALKAYPLYKLLKKDVTFEWKEEQQQAFEQLKKCLTSKPILTVYEPDASHELHTDASSMGLAGMLMQFREGDPKRVVNYYSRCTTEAEQKYSSYELEALAVVESLERFKYYLLGKSFVVVTDCNALKLTHAKKDLIPRIARWWLKIQEFDFQLQYRTSSQMSHVDALSRSTKLIEKEIEEVGNEVMVVNIREQDWIGTLQLQDETIKEIHETLNNTDVSNQKKNIEREYQIKNGKLFKKTQDGLRFVVPRGVRWRVIKGAHDDLGHGALDRTLTELKKTYWFPKMNSTVKKYINSCTECLYTQRYKDESRYQLYSSPINSVPFHTIHIDHLGPYPRSSRGNMHLLGIIDSFTKFIALKAVKNTRTQYVIRFIEEVSQYVGLPERIVSDRGTAFTSGLFQQFCEENSIQHIKTAVRTPRANGQIERYFRTVSSSISAMTTRQDGKDWDVNIAAVQWGLNNLPHRITGQSAFKLILGYEPKSILRNKLTAALHTEDSEDEDDIPLGQLRRKTADLINEGRLRQAEIVNRNKLRPSVYSEGELVLIRAEHTATGQPRKHLPRYKGPYTIKKSLGNDRYLVTDCPNLRISQKPFESVYAADKIRPWCCLDDLNIFEEASSDSELSES